MAPSETAGGRVSPRSPFGRGYLAVLALIDRVSYVAIVGVTAAMTATVTSQVYYRYVLNDSIDWADEVSRLTFVWMIFLAIPHGIRLGSHVGIDIVVNAIPAAARAWLFRASSLLGALLFVLILVQASRVAYAVWDQPMPTLPVSSGMFYVALLLGSLHSALVLVAFVLGLESEPRQAEEPS